jgi:polyphosphate kinase 2 (PPK2 family)
MCAPGWIAAAECKRRYRQINDFERMLAETGTTILKFYLHISRDEQKKRLEARRNNPEKQWKFHPGDLAVRAQWDDTWRPATRRCRPSARRMRPGTSFPPTASWHVT